uniref:Dendrocyte expressed seven transmembrane protein n=1 Tax=Varanus komodoensis TaxID=61221 RepID=A0A8D2LTP5_VARKO
TAIWMNGREIKFLPWTQLNCAATLSHVSDTGYSLVMEYLMFSIAIFAFSWIMLSIGLCFFRFLRCFAALFFLSCGLREGRNSLIAAGTGVVVAGNLQNIFHNLKQLAESVICIIESQCFSFLGHYIEAIRWIYHQTKNLSNPFKDVVSLESKLNVSYSVSDEDLKLRLNKTKLYIENITNQISSLLTLQSYLGKKVLPLLGMAFILLGTYLFIRKFLSPHNLKFKNAYITNEFIRYNEKLRQQQKPSVLPLSKEERKLYTVVPSFCQTRKDRKHTARFFLPVLTNLCIWALFAAVDYLLYWLIFSVSKHLQDLPELEVHLKLYYHVKGHQTILHPKHLFYLSCIPKPNFALSATWTHLGAIVFSLTVLGLLTSTLTQLKILVITSFFPSTGMKRIKYLHKKLLNRRSKFSERNMKKKPHLFATVNYKQYEM